MELSQLRLLLCINATTTDNISAYPSFGYINTLLIGSFRKPSVFINQKTNRRLRRHTGCTDERKNLRHPASGLSQTQKQEDCPIGRHPAGAAHKRHPCTEPRHAEPGAGLHLGHATQCCCYRNIQRAECRTALCNEDNRDYRPEPGARLPERIYASSNPSAP